MFSEDDLQRYNELSRVIAQGNFNLKGDAVVRAASLFSWYTQLGGKLKLAVELERDKNKAPENPIEKLEEDK